jgi:hypothetical protein
MSDYISGSISNENKAKALSLIDELNKTLPLTINLNKDDKAAMPKMDDGRLPFVEKSLQYGQQNPKIAPAYIDINELNNDLNLFKDYQEIEKRLTVLLETVQNVRVAAGTDAYTTALIIYRAAQGAAKDGIPGTKAIVDDLKKMFESQGNKTANPTSTAKT